MGRGGWREFRTKCGSFSFDVLESRFIRGRCKKRDTPAEKAYCVADAATLAHVRTEYRDADGNVRTVIEGADGDGIR